MPLLNLPRTVGRGEIWESTNWTQPGLPPRFRISLRGGTAEYRSQPISAAQRVLRTRMMSMLGSGNLVASLNSLLTATRRPPNHEYSAYIRADGTFPQLHTLRSRGYATRPAAPTTGSIVGFVHSHPTPCALFAPPSADDFGADFGARPIQLVAEMGGRIWGLFSGRYSTWLGTINGSVFNPQPHAATNQLVYRVIPGDALRLSQGQVPASTESRQPYAHASQPGTVPCHP